MVGLLALVTSVSAEETLEVPFEKYTLDNGLEVILSEDHSVPFVQVNLWYGVASKDEVEGRSGFAHLFEHLMFQGSENHDADYFVPLQRIGAVINGTTNTDRTNYFQGVPAENLPLVLWLESDRMGWLLPALTEDKLQNQKDVVRNERRQSYETRPYGNVRMWLSASMYPEGHPYHLTTIGKHEDIEAANLDDVRNFFETWYVPNNASLTIVGDFDPTTVKGLVSQYFADIPRGPQPEPVTKATASLDGEVWRSETDTVPHHKVWLAWHTPAYFQEGDASMDLVASVLGSGKTSRLVKRLVREKQIAKEIHAYQGSAMLGSKFVIEATAAPGHTVEEIVAEVDAVIDELASQGPTDQEVSLAQLEFERRTYEQLLRISNKADMLNRYNYYVDDPGYLQQDLERFTTLSAKDIQDAASTWINHDRRVVLHVGPEATEEK